MTAYRPTPVNAIECYIGSLMHNDPVRIRANEQLQTLINEIRQLRTERNARD